MDISTLFAPNLPAPAARWSGFPKYNFVGGHNDPAQMPIDGLIAATASVLKREGANLATYGLASGSQGYAPLREFLARKLKARAGMSVSADDILITGGSLQAMDLVNTLMLAPGDTVLIEQETYGGALTRLQRLGVTAIGVPLDGEGMRADALGAALDDCKSRGVKPKYVYTIPTVQNPTGAIMSEARRAEILRLAEAHGVVVYEDECYADLVWSGTRPPAFYGMATNGGVIHIGSFSKSIAPALRLGYIVAPWAALSRLIALKTDGGSGALEQMALAEFCAARFDDHVASLSRGLKLKLDAMTQALDEHFGTTAEFEPPQGGIFLWLKLPDHVDTQKLAEAAGKAGIGFNAGAEWSTDKARGRSRMRLCFANPTVETIREGVARLAEVCRAEFGVPTRSANVDRAPA